jgi:hypothetical protein
MCDLPTATTPFTTQGLREVCEVNGRHFRRKKGTQQWTEYIPEDNTNSQPLFEEQDDPLYLSLIHEKKGDGEPLHWSLYIAREN